MNWQLHCLNLRGLKHQICQKMLKGWSGVASNSGGEICSHTKLWKCEREISAKQDLGEILSRLEKRKIFLKGSLFAKMFSLFFHCNF